VTSSNRSLERVRTLPAAEPLGPLERSETTTDQELVPLGTVLLEQQDGLARRTHARPRARRLNLHQRDEAVDLRLFRCKLGQDAAEAKRLLTEGRPHPVVASRGRIPFVENQVDDLKHRRQTRREFRAARDLEWNSRLGKRSLGSHDSLRDGRLRNEKRTRDLFRRQAPEQAQRERNACLGGEHRVTGDEYEAQEIIANCIVKRGIEIRHGHLLLGLELATELFVLALEPFFSAEVVDSTVLRSGHEPGALIIRDARLRPLLERGDESVLGEFFGETDITHDSRETGNNLGGFDSPNRFDRAMGIRSRHDYPSHHLQSACASGRCGYQFAAIRPCERLLRFGSEVLGPHQLADLGLALPSGPVFFVKFHERHGPFQRLFL